MSRRLILIGSVIGGLLASVAVVAVSPAALASSRSEQRNKPLLLSASASSGPLSPGAPACDPSGRCLLGYSISSTYSGDLVGQSVANGALYLSPTTFASQGTSMELFSGRVKGCGTGSFVVHFPLFAGSAQSTVSSGVIVQGSGTGELVGITGSLQAKFVPSPTGGTSEVQLQVRCRSLPSAADDRDTADS